jgi:hypothetical protein
MDRKSIGPFLIILGFVFLAISVITIWSMFFELTSDKAVYIVLSIPLLVFSIFSIFFGFYSVFERRLGIKARVLILLIDGFIPVIASIVTILDTRLVDIHHIRLLILFPLTLVGIFIIAYGIFLLLTEYYFKDLKRKKLYKKTLGLVSIGIGIVNVIAYLFLIQIAVEYSLALSFFWVIIGALLIYFGFYLIFKSVEKKRISK